MTKGEREDTLSGFTIDDLRRFLRECSGETAGLDGDILDVPFEELGYDSLALLEVISRVEDEFGIRVPDEAAQHCRTPRAVLDCITPLMAV